MELKEYFWLAMRTDAQLTDEQRRKAGTRGVFEETGELLGVFNKHLYQGQPLNKEKAILEMGDITWRCMQTLKALDCIPLYSSSYPSSDAVLDYQLFMLIMSVSNLVKLEDEYSKASTPSQKEKQANEMVNMITHNIFYNLANIAILLDTDISEVFEANIKKLEKRYEEKLFSTAASIARVDTLQFEVMEDHYRVLPPDPNKVYLNTYDAANLLNVDQLWLHKHLLSTGVLSCSEIDRSSKIPLDELLSWKENRDKNRKVGLNKLTELSEELGLYQDKE